METSFSHLQVHPDTATVTCRNTSYSLKKTWYQWKVSYLSVQKDGSLTVRSLNIFQRGVRFLFRAYANTHSKCLQNALKRHDIQWSPIKKQGAQTRIELLQKIQAAQQATRLRNNPPPESPPPESPPSVPKEFYVDYLVEQGEKDTDVFSLFCLAKMYEDGNKVPQDITQAVDLYQKIINSHTSLFMQDQAQLFLTRLYERFAKEHNNLYLYSCNTYPLAKVNESALLSTNDGFGVLYATSIVFDPQMTDASYHLIEMSKSYCHLCVIRKVENTPHHDILDILAVISSYMDSKKILENDTFVGLTFFLLFLWKVEKEEKAQDLLRALLEREDVPKNSRQEREIPSFDELSQNFTPLLEKYSSDNEMTSLIAGMLYEEHGNPIQAYRCFSDPNAFPIGQYKSGQMLEKGEGVEQNQEEAIKSYKKVAKNYLPAYEALLRLYREREEDPIKVRQLLKKAAESGWVPAMQELLVYYEKKGNQEKVKKYREEIAIATQSYDIESLFAEPRPIPDYTWLMEKDSFPSSLFLRKFSFNLTPSIISKQLDALEKTLPGLDAQKKQRAIREWANDLQCYAFQKNRKEDPTVFLRLAQFFHQHAFMKEATTYYKYAAYQHSLPAMDALSEIYQNQFQHAKLSKFFKLSEKFNESTYWIVAAWLFETDPAKKTEKEDKLKTWLNRPKPPSDTPSFTQLTEEEYYQKKIFKESWGENQNPFNPRCRGKLAMDYGKTSDDIQVFQTYNQDSTSPESIHKHILDISKVRIKIDKKEKKLQIPHQNVDEEDKIALYRRLSYLCEKTNDLQTSSIYLAGAVLLGYRPSQDEFPSVRDRLSSFLDV